MAGLLALLGPAGRVGARLRLPPPWLLGTATSCTPPLWAVALSRPGPDARLLRTARGDCLRLQAPNRTTDPGSGATSTEKKLSKSQQLKKVFQEYGAVGVSLHIGISLVSLGIFYTIVSSPSGPARRLSGLNACQTSPTAWVSVLEPTMEGTDS
ncbi:protein FAM210B, mitochondrial isoform X2 [Rattus norvegicus]|uniref:protein FAM210B, mitochondrial isoform X2 n=1 Tax=Rattus norvegicus TaxID=10116 RepID=UPI0003D07AAB|nr:protein FAM210B, mitochondrial isoform X2 [Rattus norvegicus]